MTKKKQHNKQQPSGQRRALQTPVQEAVPVQETAPLQQAAPVMKTAPAQEGKPRRHRKIYEFDTVKDIRYRGPLSYREFKLLGWICIALAQVALLLTLEVRMDPSMAVQLNSPISMLKAVSNLALPFLLIANFALILNAGEGYGKQLLRYGLLSAAVILASVFAYHRYIIGAVAVFSESRAEALSTLDDLIHQVIPGGYYSFNLFIDLFLCTLLMFFLNARPKRLFTGKKLLIFRAFAALPILYEVASIVLKNLSVEGRVTLPLIVYPFLTVKPVLCFVVFVVLAFYIKSRERIFLKNGRSFEDYQAFLKTNRNSFHFSGFTAIILVAAGILDVILIFVIMGAVQLPADAGETALAYLLMHMDVFGFGQSTTLLAMAPIMLLFSYTRTHKNKTLDLIIPILGIVLIAFVYLEGLFEFVKMIPDLLDGINLGGILSSVTG